MLYAGQPHFHQTGVVPGLIGEGTGGVTEFLYRRYLPVVRPFTFAVRALHFGRYGPASEDPRLSPLFVGYPTAVRGYDVNSFGAGECIPDAQSECPVFDQLSDPGCSSGNAELRVPLVGAFTGEYR